MVTDIKLANKLFINLRNLQPNLHLMRQFIIYSNKLIDHQLLSMKGMKGPLYCSMRWIVFLHALS